MAIVAGAKAIETLVSESNQREPRLKITAGIPNRSVLPNKLPNSIAVYRKRKKRDNIRKLLKRKAHGDTTPLIYYLGWLLFLK